MSKKTCTPQDCSRLNKVGGQAVLEGVMMKAGERTVTSCRKEDGSIVVTDSTFVSVRKKKKILNLPILRGFVNFIEMMALSVKTLNISAEALGIEDEKEKAKKEKARAEGKRATGTLDIVMVLGVVLGLLLSVGLFFVLPSLISDGISWLYTRFISESGIGIVGIAVIEGLVKIAIFLTYLSLVILMPDIRRTFMYHGAEHKSIACFEAGEELTPENAMKHRRFHPRCGTSFMFLMILIGIFIGIFVRFILPPEEAFPFVWLYSLCVSGIKILLLPITMGIGYEILMLAGKHDNIFTRIISAPGMWVQRLTTKEPTEDMLEVAITSIKCALRDEYPEFREFFENEGWKKEPELEVEIVCEEADSESVDENNSVQSDREIIEAVVGADGEAENAPEATDGEAESAPEVADGEAESAPEATDEPEVTDCDPEKVNPTEDEDDA